MGKRFLHHRGGGGQKRFGWQLCLSILSNAKRKTSPLKTLAVVCIYKNKINKIIISKYQIAVVSPTSGFANDQFAYIFDQFVYVLSRFANKL